MSEANDPDPDTPGTDAEADSANKLHDTVDFSPKKEDMYRAIMADVDVVEAILELSDNSIDNWERVSSKTDPLTIEVFTRTTDDGDTEFVIRDDSGGVRRSELAMLFGIGRSARDEIEGSVGAYGVGAKRAIMRLADEATVATRYKSGTDTGYGFTVDRDWLEDDTWERPIEEFDIPEGQTEIRLRNLNFQPENKLDEIRQELQRAYEIFLGGGPRYDDAKDEDYDFVIRVDGEPIDQPDPVNWSFTPFDGLHPRQFTNIDLDSKETEDPVHLDVTVGLMQTAAESEAGTDFYLQQRQVHHAQKDEQGGFGLVDKMGEWDGQQKRLKIIAELRTDGDSRDLPWNSSKTGLDTDSEIAKQAFDWIGRIAERYYDAVYGTVPQTFLRPYGRGADHTVDGQLGDDALDYAGREKVTDKPTKGYPDIQRAKKMATEHARFGIKYTGDLREEFIPAYEEHLANRLQNQFDPLYGEDYEPVVLDEAPDFDPGNGGDIATEIDGWARSDAREPQRYTGLEAWKQARYDAVLATRLPDNMDLDEVETVDTRDEDDDTAGRSLDAFERDDTEDDEEAASADGEDVESDTTAVDVDDTESETVTTQTDESATDSTVESTGTNEDTSTSDEVDITIEGEDGHLVFPIELTPEQKELFEAVLGVDDFEATTPAERGEALADRMERLQAVLQAATPQAD